ncbi:FecR family protein [Fibrivirga algicola]|uniref:FecR family protein n=1 Tax=Fibrivirga algicola TaxID=2950420 RepID=A0ABX0QCQ6_9BACT|nr:FecR family protein [Fibrivirga algicola]NID10150.1 FecR family protein [Fibrivirga algicola]
MNLAAMPDYSTFSAEDFASDPAFQTWVNTPTSDTNAFWHDWVQAHPDQAANIGLARQVVLNLHATYPPIPQQQIDHDIARLLERVRRQSSPPFQVTRSLGYRYWVAAASVVLALGVGWFVTQKTNLIRPTSIELQTINGEPVYQNEADGPLPVTLPDGSIVTLSARSTLRYTAAFGQKTRDVTLTGQAFFSVTRNEKVPFRVFTDELVTQVLGTSFRVSAYPEDRRSTVTVRTGKVAVYARAESENPLKRTVLSLTPNQVAEYSRKSHVLHKTLTIHPVPVNNVPAADAFVFDETPINDVFRRLEETYGIQIKYDANLLRDCALTASLGNENLNQKLTLICKGIEGRYQIVDGTIIIQSTGCR